MSICGSDENVRLILKILTNFYYVMDIRIVFEAADNNSREKKNKLPKITSPILHFLSL